MPFIPTTFTDGVDGQAAGSTVMQFTVGPGWLAGDSWGINVTDVTGSIQVGRGAVFRAVPVSAITLANKLYFVAGTTLYFSAIGDPTRFDPQDVGSGFIVISSRSATSEALVGLASYQGRLAVFSRRTTQIWTIDANPANYVLNQVLANIGALSSEAIKSFGDMDVFFGSDTGVRSLRVRDSSLNAFVSDIGSPIDSPFAASLAKQKVSGNAICAVVEPSANRYWVFLQDTIYVLSYFPSSKVAAWSNYVPTYYQVASQMQVAFTPVKFVVVDQTVWVRAADGAVYVYGGTDGTVYDNATTVVETPWLDVKKPGTRKQGEAVDISWVGNWTLKGSTSYLDRVLRFQILYANKDPSFDKGRVGWAAQGTHFKLRAENSDSALVTLSMFLWHYKELNEK